MQVETFQALADLSGSPMLQEIADNGPYLGFDTSEYPGDAAMQTWREHAGYDWVGYYLQAPCHKDASWTGKRDTLETMGWGMAVIYVGGLAELAVLTGSLATSAILGAAPFAALDLAKCLVAAALAPRGPAETP